MAPKWIGFLVFVWVCALLIGSVSVGEIMLENSTLTNPVQHLMSYVQIFSEQSWGSAFVYTVTSSDFYTSVGRMLVLDFPMFGAPDSPWQIVRWLVLGPITATMVYGMIIAAFQFFQRTVS